MVSPKLIFCGLAGGLLVSACSSVPKIPPVMAGPTKCASSLDLGGAISLTPEKPKKRFEVEQSIVSGSDCIQSADGNDYYAVFELPEDTNKKIFTIGSVVEYLRVFPAKISTLDADGNMLRTIDDSDMHFRGLLYSTQIRARENEAYILVKSDSSKVGEIYDSIVTGFTPASNYTFSSGTDTSIRRKFSYEGDLMVVVLDQLDKDDLK